jgi:hypothetical protein
LDSANQAIAAFVFLKGAGDRNSKVKLFRDFLERCWLFYLLILNHQYTVQSMLLHGCLDSQGWGSDIRKQVLD